MRMLTALIPLLQRQRSASWVVESASPGEEGSDEVVGESGVVAVMQMVGFWKVFLVQ